MINKLLRSSPVRRMSVRAPRSSSFGSGGHKSFKLSKPEKQKLMGKAFGSYVPEKFKRHLSTAKAHRAGDKDEAYFLRQIKSDRTLTSKEDVQKFSRGLLKQAHDEGVKLKEGYNPVGHEYEQAQKLAKEAEQQRPLSQDQRPRDQAAAHRDALSKVRDRLDTQHGRSVQPATAPAYQNPQPLPQETVNEPTPAAPGPVFSPTSSGFTGGRVTTHHETRSAVALPDTQAPTHPTPPEAQESADNTAESEVQIPDPNEAQELPI